MKSSVLLPSLLSPPQTTMDSPSSPLISPRDRAGGGDPPSSPQAPDCFTELQAQNEFLLSELLFFRVSFQTVEAMYVEAEESVLSLQEQRDAALARCETLEELRIERDVLREEVSGCRRREEELLRRIGAAERERESLEREIYEGMREREELVKREEGFANEIRGFRVKIEDLEHERREKDRIALKISESLSAIKESLIGLCEGLDEEKEGDENGAVEDGDESKEGDSYSDESSDSSSFCASMVEFNAVSKLLKRVETRLSDYRARTRREKKELESSLVSLTEENRDTNSLLRIALIEKEAVEKSLNKLKGNTDLKRAPLLQIAERGLQRVGFGFMMGAANDPSPALADTASSTASNMSDSSECEEEVVSLASTVEKIMKNLRQEITKLRKELEESRSDIERLQSLTDRQAQQLTEQALYIKELEDREAMLTQNVEELLSEMKAADEDIARWREACELEVEAGKTVVDERDKVTDILKQELEKTRAALEVSNNKLKMKEELAAAAMAAQEAAERSLQLTDSRASGLRERIEQLTRQLEEAESRERNMRRVRDICWPWRALKANASAAATGGANRITSVTRMLPEMQALLHYSV